MVVNFLDAKVRHIIEFNQFLSIHILHIYKNIGGGYIIDIQSFTAHNTYFTRKDYI